MMRLTARMLATGVLVFAACTGGEPAPEPGDADASESVAVEEQESVAQLEPDSAEDAPSAAEPRVDEPRAAEDVGLAGGGAQPAQPESIPAADAQAQAPADAPQEGQAATEGVIAVMGTDIDSRPVLQTEDGMLGVTGDLTAELRRLSGARVRVEGERRSGRLPGESIEVSNYTVLEVNGERPEVGTISLRDGAPWLEGRDTVRLIGAADRFVDLEAAKVWVTGRRTDQGLEVGSYGVIRR